MTDDGEAETQEATDLKFVGPATAESLAAASFGPEAIRRKTVSFSMLLDAGVNPGVAARIRREHSLPWSFETEDRQDLDRRSDQIRGLGDGERAWVAASSGDWTEEETPTETGGDGGEDGDEDDTPDLPGDWSVPEPEDGRRPEAIDLSTEIGPEDGDRTSPDAAIPTPEPTDTDEDHDSGGSKTTADTAESSPGSADSIADGQDATGNTQSATGDTSDVTADGTATATEADGSGDPVAAESAWRQRSAPVPVSALDGVDESVRATLADAGITSVRSLASADPATVASALDMSEAAVAELRDSAAAYTE
ncbi:MAG: helix-hairpin-helix domain-containing protein [Halobaculum sp.]